MNKKTVIQVFLVLLIILISLIFYLRYFDISSKIIEQNKITGRNDSDQNSSSTLIKNIDYNSYDAKGNRYQISGELAEIRDENSNMGGTMRLGSQKAPIRSKTLAYQIYGKTVNERHRHRYEVNNDYVDQLIKAGLVVSARTPSEDLCEIIELPLTEHPWFLGCQFHPEFTSNPKEGHPLFISYLKASLKYQHSKGN